MTNKERLTEAVRRVEEAIAYGAKIRGIELPPDFAIERARNIVSALVDLFEDAEDAGFSRGYKDSVERWPEPASGDGEPS